MTLILAFEIDCSSPNKLPPISMNGSHGHWRTAAATRAKWKRSASFAIMKHKIPDAPLKKAKLILVRRSSRPPDYDGLVSSFKPIVDALKAMKVIEDDSMKIVGAPEYRYEVAGRGKGSIRVEVWA